MKKILCLLTVFIITFALAACKNQSTHSVGDSKFYYRTASTTSDTKNSVIDFEYRKSSSDIKDILQNYLNGPLDKKLVSPFPENLSISEFDTGPARASIVLSEEITELKGHQLTIACSCLAKTIFELAGTRSVEIKCESGLIGGQQSIVLISKDIVINDTYFESLDENS